VSDKHAAHRFVDERLLFGCREQHSTPDRRRASQRRGHHVDVDVDPDQVDPSVDKWDQLLAADTAKIENRLQAGEEGRQLVVQHLEIRCRGVILRVVHSNGLSADRRQPGHDVT